MMQASRAQRLSLALAIAMLLLGLMPFALPLLDWNRAAILDGQWYRLLTAHLVHLGAWHLALNGLALLLLGELFWRQLSARTVAALLLASALGVGLGLFWAAPELWHYAGFSGVLHGAWAGSALLLLQQRSEPGESAHRWWALALLMLAVKLLLENFWGSGVAWRSIEAPVILQSHALGALAGVTFAGFASLAKAARTALAGVTSVQVFD